MKPVISIIMGKIRLGCHAKKTWILDRFGVAYEKKKVVSAHRTPDLMFRHAEE